MVRIATHAFKGSYDPVRNLERHLAGIANGRKAGADLVVFPECSLNGYPRPVPDENEMLAGVYRSAHMLDGEEVAAITDAARAAAVHVVFGISERGERPGELYNTSILVGPRGLVGTHRKVHLSPAERVSWTRGSQWDVFPTPLGRIGLLICYDQAWPEGSRALTLAGADLLVMSAAWSHVGEVDGHENSPRTLSEEQYLLYGRARAAENMRWFISSNYSGVHAEANYFGHSQVIDPNGRVLADAVGEDEVAVVDIDVRRGIEDACARGVPPGDRVFRDRRAATYAQLVETRSAE
jgi:predicted amidohydrolase